MADDPDPPRQYFRLKPKQYETVNDGIVPDASAVPTAPDPGPGGGPAGRIDVRDLCRQAGPPVPLRGAAQRRAALPANDVHAVLRENLAAAEAAGLNRVTLPPPKRSRRKRDYWISLGALFGLLGGSLLVTGPNLISLAYAGGGAILLGVGLTWIFWVVLDDY